MIANVGLRGRREKKGESKAISKRMERENEKELQMVERGEVKD